jgi:hypothetical protein
MIQEIDEATESMGKARMKEAHQQEKRSEIVKLLKTELSTNFAHN